MSHGYIFVDNILCGSCGALMAFTFVRPQPFEAYGKVITVDEQRFKATIHCQNPSCKEHEKSFTAPLTRVELDEIPVEDGDD